MGKLDLSSESLNKTSELADKLFNHFQYDKVQAQRQSQQTAKRQEILAHKEKQKLYTMVPEEEESEDAEHENQKR